MADGFFVQMEDYNRLLSAEADLAEARADIDTLRTMVMNEAGRLTSLDLEAAIVERDAARADLSEARAEIERLTLRSDRAENMCSVHHDAKFKAERDLDTLIKGLEQVGWREGDGRIFSLSDAALVVLQAHVVGQSSARDASRTDWPEQEETVAQAAPPYTAENPCDTCWSTPSRHCCYANDDGL